MEIDQNKSNNDVFIKKLIKKLSRKLSRVNLNNVEYSPSAIEKEEIPPVTKEDSSSIFTDLLLGRNLKDIRNVINDRYARYREYEEMCLSGDTKICLLQGDCITLKDWYEKCQETYFFVYSYDIKKNKITYGIAYNPRITRKNAILYKITLSNNSSFKATEDHKILMEDNTYKQVKDLKAGDKIKSLIRKKTESKNYYGYEQIYSQEEKKWKYTHQEIAKDFFKESIFNENVDIHHKNKKITDNRPTNFEIISKGKHYIKHEKEKYIKENNLYLFDLKEGSKSKSIFSKTVYYSEEKSIEVKKIEILNVREDVFDITVFPNNNFAIGCNIFVHNCDDPVIDGAIDTYTYELIKTNERGECLEINGDPKIVKLLKNLFFNKLNIKQLLKRIIRDMCIYGDTFYEIIFSKNLDDVLYIKYINPYRIHIDEQNEKIKNYYYLKNIDINKISRYSTYYYSHQSSPFDKKDGVKIPTWRIVHFRIEDSKYFPYGRSILDSCRVAWKQLKLLEDAMVIYRVVRAPQRRVWKIGTGQLSFEKSLEYIKKLIGIYKKKQIINPLTGEITEQPKAQSMLEDYWIPIPKGTEASTSVETLDAGGAGKFSDIDDVLYFRYKIITGKLGLPEAWLRGEYRTSGKSLSMLDAQFAERIEILQDFVVRGLYKIAYIYLILKGFQPSRLKSIKLNLVPPSVWSENAKYELLNNKINFINNLKGTGLYPMIYILENYLGHSKDEILYILSLLQVEQQGGDILSLLTGKPTQPEQPPQQQEIEKQMEKELTGKPTETETTTAPEETEEEAIEKELKPEKVPTPSELALKALLNIENINKEDFKKILLETIENIRKQKEEKNNIEQYSLIYFITNNEIDLIDLKKQLPENNNKLNNLLIETENNNIYSNNYVSFVDYIKQFENENKKSKKQIKKEVKILEEKIEKKENL